MTDLRRQVLLVSAAMLVLPAAVVVVLVLHPGTRAAAPGAQPGPPPPYPTAIVRNGVEYEATETVVDAASVDPGDPRLLYVFVDDESDASDAKCSGRYPTVAVVRQDTRSVTLRAVNYVEMAALPSNGSYTCVTSADQVIRLRLRIDSPVGKRTLRDDVGHRPIHRIDPAISCPELLQCHP